MTHGVKGRTSGAAGVRRACGGDVAALVRLRAVMFAGMGRPTDGEWPAAARRWFAEQLARPARFAAYVAEDPALGVVSVACGMCDDRPPGPGTLQPVRGYVFNVATDPRRRRRGHARACLEALLGWFASETPAELVDLTATADGAGLYASLGFRPREAPVMRASV